MIYSKYLFFKELVINRLRHRPTPMYLYWFITENCNLKCSYCYGNFCKKPSTDLSKEEALTLIDGFARGGVRRITILGGEPLLYKHIGAVVDELRRRNISCSILTNGELVTKKIDVLRKVDEVGLSIDGPPETHDSIRGTGNFEKMLQTIYALKKIKKAVVLTYTLFSGNIHEIAYVLEFVRKHNVFLTVNVAHGRINEEKDDPVAKAENENICQALEKVVECKRRGYPIFRTHRTLRQMLAWDDYGVDGSDTKPCSGFPVCQFGKYAACVSADGTLYPCFLGTDIKSGKNILNEGFEKAWEHCQSIDHCLYCHVPCFIEYNALLNLSPSVIFSIVDKLIVKKLFPSK